ncbi:MAG: PAS domain S-box protein [Nannocystaceae bacterium]|nr:PAS domain S-box protein [Nannocystaceae bacterium]
MPAWWFVAGVAVVVSVGLAAASARDHSGALWLFAAASTIGALASLGRAAAGHMRLARALDRAAGDATIDGPLRDLVLQAPAAMLRVDASGRCSFANTAWTQLTGQSIATALGRGWAQAIHPDDRETLVSAWGGSAPADFYLELRLRHVDGGQVWVTFGSASVAGADGKPSEYLLVLMDVTARQRATAALQRSEANFRATIEHAPLGFVVLRAGRLLYANAGATALLGAVDAAALQDEGYLAFVEPAQRMPLLRRLDQVARGARMLPAPICVARPDGQRRVLHGNAAVVDFDGAPAVGVFVHDVTARDLDERAGAAIRERLRASLAEKESLLKEVHHRVKNNLQVIASLISLQAETLADPAARVAFAEMRSRIKTIAAIHERIYRAPDLTRIDLKGYLGDLVRELARAMAQPGCRVATIVEVEPIALSLDTMVPLALLVNELVTNAFKHAFPAGARDRGTIHVRLRRVDGGIELSVRDDGVGMSPRADDGRPSSLGLSLVDGFAQQLDGTVGMAGHDGTAWSIRFPEPSAALEAAA